MNIVNFAIPQTLKKEDKRFDYFTDMISQAVRQRFGHKILPSAHQQLMQE